MNVIFKSSFRRNVNKITNKELLLLIENAIENVISADNIKDIKNLKKLVGYKTYYRIRVKDYRIGINILDDIVYFVCCLPRKDIYKMFP